MKFRLPKFLSFGVSGEEGERLSGVALVPYAPGKGPGKFVSAGEGETASVGGNGNGGFFKGMGQGAGIGIGLLAFGTIYSWVRRKH